MKPMQKESLTKGTEKILTTKNPYLKGGPTRWPTHELPREQLIAVSVETQMAALETSKAHESAKPNTNESNI